MCFALYVVPDASTSTVPDATTVVDVETSASHQPETYPHVDRTHSSTDSEEEDSSENEVCPSSAGKMNVIVQSGDFGWVVIKNKDV